MIFINANVGLDICIHWLLVHDKITAEGSVIIYTVQMLYAGYQTKQIFNDKTKIISESNDSGQEEGLSKTEQGA